MRQYVGDSFPDEICHLVFGYISQFTCKAHINSCSDEPKDLGVLRAKRGALYNGEVTLKTFEEMPYELKRGQMSFEAEKSKQSVN